MEEKEKGIKTIGVIISDFFNLEELITYIIVRAKTKEERNGEVQEAPQKIKLWVVVSAYCFP